MSFDLWANHRLPDHLASVSACSDPESTELCIRRLANEAWCEAAFEERRNGVRQDDYRALVHKLVRPGDILTHTRCLGSIEEHIYTQNDGYWLCGLPTHDSTLLSYALDEVRDISPLSVTHINRLPVAEVDRRRTAVTKTA
jgi:hypothetical protein